MIYDTHAKFPYAVSVRMSAQLYLHTHVYVYFRLVCESIRRWPHPRPKYLAACHLAQIFMGIWERWWCCGCWRYCGGMVEKEKKECCKTRTVHGTKRIIVKWSTCDIIIIGALSSAHFDKRGFPQVLITKRYSSYISLETLILFS